MRKSVLEYFTKYKIRTFTYFIPSPPKRKTGYQEKEFDQLISYINNQNYKICNIQTQASTGDESSGMWVIVLVRPLSKEASLNELEYSTETDSKDDIELSL